MKPTKGFREKNGCRRREGGGGLDLEVSVELALGINLCNTLGRDWETLDGLRIRDRRGCAATKFRGRPKESIELLSMDQHR